MADASSSTDVAAQAEAQPLFKKKAPRSRDVRQRPAEAASSTSTGGDTSQRGGGSSRSHPDDVADSGAEAPQADEEEEPARSEVVLKRKAPPSSNPLVSRTAGAAALANKRQRLNGEDDDDDDDYGDIGAVDRFGERTVHSARMKGNHDADSTLSSRERARQDATRDRNWNGADGEDDGPGSRPSEAALTLSKDDPEADGLYRGLSAYASHAPALRDDGSSSKLRAKGPIKPTANIRTVSVVDYQPDVCKDYKETGYCGFGDTCKFLHDRSDYLAGWQLALVPEAYSGGKRRDDVSLGLIDAAEEALAAEEEEIPFACLLCRQPFTEPVVTRCGHYFCMSCAIKRYAKNPKCFACGKATNGLFSSATKILERMEKKREIRAEAIREKRRAWGQGEEGEGGEQRSGEILDGVEIE